METRLRSVLAWVLTSPLRLVLMVVAVVGLSVGAALLGAGHDTGSRSSTSSTPGAEPASSASSSGGGASVPAPEESVATDESVRPTVERFLAGYLGATSAQQLRSLKPFVTAQLWQGLRLADPSALPAGPASRLAPTALGAFGATYAATTRDGRLDVSLVLEPGGWKVNDVVRATSP